MRNSMKRQIGLLQIRWWWWVRQAGPGMAPKEGPPQGGVGAFTLAAAEKERAVRLVYHAQPRPEALQGGGAGAVSYQWLLDSASACELKPLAGYWVSNT